MIARRLQAMIVLVVLLAPVMPFSLPALAAGDRRGTLVSGGDRRSYLIHVPGSYSKDKPCPLVLALHGGGGQGAGMLALTGFNRVADRHRFIVVYPDGKGRHWNDGRQVMRGEDDVAFVGKLLDTLEGQFNIDKQRIYATGISNGGFMSEHLACVMSGRIAAVALVAATMAEETRRTCSPGRAVPITFLLGVADPLVPWAGGAIGIKLKNRPLLERLRRNRGAVIPAREAVNFWVENNRCGQAQVTDLPDASTRDGTRIRREIYPGANGADVVLYVIDGGGHTWPGGKQYLPESIIGKTSRDLDASEVIWDFFQSHPLKGGPS